MADGSERMTGGLIKDIIGIKEIVMKDNQITGIERHPREIKWDRFVKHYGKSVPIQCWSEVKQHEILPVDWFTYKNMETVVRNSGGKTYLVTQIGGKL